MLVRNILLLSIFFLLDHQVVSTNEYVNALVKLHGNNDSISVDQLDSFITSLKYKNKAIVTKNKLKKQTLNASCHLCSAECSSAKEIFQQFNFNPNESIGLNQVQQISTALLFRIQNTNCYLNSTDNNDINIGVAENWGYGFLFVTLINLSSLIGALFAPVMKFKMFKFLLIFMVALAVGALLGMALLFLIPEALHLANIAKEEPQFNGYLYKTSAVAGGIYMFFIFERILKYFIGLKQKNRIGNHGHSHMTLLHLNGEKKITNDLHAQGLNLDKSSARSDKLMYNNALENASQPKVNDDGIVDEKRDDHEKVDEITSTIKEKSEVVIAPVAWMIIIGDTIHNFIDALSIGAMFSTSTLSGIVISITILCEELPHKLGDLALLLNAGMRIKQALGWSLLSSSSSYLGFTVGMLLGELTNATVWVFAVASGMFLYIAMVDLLPEMNEAIENEESLMLGRGKIFIFQNLGLVAGFSILLILAFYGKTIKF